MGFDNEQTFTSKGRNDLKRRYPNAGSNKNVTSGDLCPEHSLIYIIEFRHHLREEWSLSKRSSVSMGPNYSCQNWNGCCDQNLLAKTGSKSKDRHVHQFHTSVHGIYEKTVAKKLLLINAYRYRIFCSAQMLINRPHTWIYLQNQTAR